MKPVFLGIQQIILQRMYPSLIEKIYIKHRELTCIMRLQPSETSIVYKIRIRFRLGCYPKAWLLEPKELAQVDGNYPHHIYEITKKGYTRLCVFDPHKNEWKDSMYLAKVFVPWIITWLSSYEYWQITGQWVYPKAESLNRVTAK